MIYKYNNIYVFTENISKLIKICDIQHLNFSKN